MNKFLKVLGVAALAVGLTPYKVEKDEETGENKYQALLWQATRAPKAAEGEKGEINITLGFNSPFEKDEEAHLFSDDLSVEYVAPKPEEETAEPEAPEAPAEVQEEAAASAEEAVPEEAPAAEEAPAEEPEAEKPAEVESTEA